MTEFELARALFRKEPNEVETKSAHVTTQIHGYATSASVDGSVTVVLDSNAGGEDAEMEVPTLGGITEGAEVMVTLVDGTPVDCSQVGSIDTTAATANSAQAVANATAQHVWTDDSGLHVTEVEQDEWNDSTSEGYHSGMNVLINSLGQLFRNGLNNLLALVSGTDPAIEIYDGQGNDAENVVARFTKNLIELGDENAEIRLCGDKGIVKYDSGKALPFQILGEDNVFIGTSLRTGCSVSVRNSSAYNGISLYADEISLEGNTLNVWPHGDGVHTYTMQHVIDVLDGSEDGTFTAGAYCNTYSRASVWRQGHMGGLSVVLQTTSNTTRAWAEIGTISIHPKAEVRAFCGNETGTFSVVNISTAGKVTILQGSAGSMWSQINCVFPA